MEILKKYSKFITLLTEYLCNLLLKRKTKSVHNGFIRFIIKRFHEIHIIWW
jgi:hypothetical protein